MRCPGQRIWVHRNSGCSCCKKVLWLAASKHELLQALQLTNPYQILSLLKRNYRGQDISVFESPPRESSVRLHEGF